MAALAIVYAIRHTSRRTTQPERRPLRIRIRPVLVGPLRSLFAGIGAFELGNFAATLLILRATQLLEPGRSTDAATTIALGLYTAYNIAATLTSLAAGRYSDRTNPTRVLTIGIAGFALAYLGFTHNTTTWAALLPWFVLAGIGCAETAEHAAVATHARTNLRGSAFGLLAGIQSLGNLAASTIAGIIWTTLSPSWAFAYLATCMIGALAALAANRHANAPSRARDS
jgi:MFS family permease